MKLKDLAVDHDYYASDSNYYSNDASMKYNTWPEFNDEFHDADVDMNLCYRWDIHEYEEDIAGAKAYYMEIFMIHQRKGIYRPIHISRVFDKDAPSIIEYMEKHWDKIKRLWSPISGVKLEPVEVSQ